MLCTLEQVYEVLKAPGRRGRTNAHQVAIRMSALCESPLETAAWDLFAIRNLELPTQQLWVSEDHRADFTWKSLRLVLEADGELKYSGQYGVARQVIQNERHHQWALEKGRVDGNANGLERSSPYTGSVGGAAERIWGESPLDTVKVAFYRAKIPRKTPLSLTASRQPQART